MTNISFSAQNMIDTAFSQDQAQPEVQQNTLPNPQSTEDKSFGEQYFPQHDQNTILEDLGAAPDNPEMKRYRFAGDGKIYRSKADKPLDKVLEGIWDHNSPGMWGSAKAQTLYGLPADMSSAIAYGLGGLGLDESSDEWRSHSDKLREEYQKKYGQFMVPGLDQALDEGKVWDYAMQNMGFMAPYMGMAVLGGWAGGMLGAGAAGGSAVASSGAAGASAVARAAHLGSFIGATGITSPVMIAQFADRQVAEMRAAGVEDPEKRIDWLKAAGLGVAASAMQALPVESILFGGPILNALTKWGVKTGTPTSARILASMADIAGTNALVGAGTGFLSRLNADMPLLDDNAKTEYLEGAIVGSLVGLPFGLYRGLRPPKHNNVVDENKTTDQVFDESTVPPTEISGLLEDKTGKPLLLPAPRESIFHNEKSTYGIQNAEDAAAFLDGLKYERDGKERTGLEDFVRKHGISYSDAQIVDEARRVSRVTDLQNYLKQTKDGVLFPDLNSVPQVHSNDPLTISKARYLTDYFGYEDATIKSLSDAMIKKLYTVNVKRELGKNPMHAEAMEQVLRKADEIVDDQALKEVQEYGSLYNRPEALKRTGQLAAQRKATIEQNPREKFAQMLYKSREKDVQRQPTGETIRQGYDPKLQRDNLDQKAKDIFYKENIDAPRMDEAPGRLLEYKPLADDIDKAANVPGPRVSERKTKNDVINNYLKTPLGQAMLKLFPNQKAMVEAIRRGAKKQREPKLKASPDGTFARSTKRPFKEKQEVPFGKEEHDFLTQVRDDLRKASETKNKELLKANPELGPALNEMFKRFAETQTETNILKNPTTSVFKAKQVGIIDAIANRAQVLRAFENAFKHLGPKIGTQVGTVFDSMLTGKPVEPREAAQVLTLMDMAFHYNTPELKNVNVGAIESLYGKLRDGLDPKTIKSLDESRDFLEKWYQSSHGIQTAKDLPAFSTKELEAAAFADYIRDTFAPAYKQFHKSKQSRVFKQFETVLNRLKKELGDQGYNKVDDLLEFNSAQGRLEAVPIESQRPGVLHRRLIEEVERADAPKRAEEISERVKANADRLNLEIPKDGFRKPPSKYKGTPLTGDLADEANNVGSAWHSFAWARSIPSLAREVPIISRVYNNVLRQHTLAGEFQTRWANKFSPVYNQSGWANMHKAHQILDHLRLTDQPLKKDGMGRFIVKSPKGNDGVLSHEMTKAVEGVTDIYKEPYRANDQITRDMLGKYFKDEGLSNDSSLPHIKRVINGLEAKIKGNPFPQQAHLYRLKQEALTQVYDNLSEINDIINSSNPYVPYMRFGDYVLTVKDRKTGDVEHIESINEVNKFGNINKFGNTKKLPSAREAEQKIRDLGLREKYNPKDYEIIPHQLTYNEIGKYINKGLVSTDLIQSLLSSGLNENMKTADHLASGVDNPTEFFKAISKDVTENKYRILRYVNARGAGKFSLKADKIPGYSKDWGRVMDTYLNIQANSLAKKAKMQEFGEIQADIIRHEMPQHVRDKINKYLDYQNEPGNDYGGIRWFNFTWAMGLSPSSAMLQLLTLPMQTFALGLEYSPNVFRNYIEFSQALKRNAAHAGTMGNAALPVHVQRIIDKVPSLFRTGVMEDTIRGSVPMDMVSSRLPIGSKAQQIAMHGAKVVRDAPGFLIKPAEKYTRTSTYDFYYTMFKNRPETFRAALKQREKDWNWQGFWENYKDVLDLDEAMAAYSMVEPHAVYGKEARGELQRGLLGSLLFPFTNYAQQVAEVLGTQLSGKRGLPGLRAGLWTMGTYVGLAGLAGIPAYTLWTTMYEAYQSAVNNRVVDAEMEMSEAGVPDWMRHGLLSSASGLDVSSRIGQEVIAQKLLEGAIKGEYKFEDVTGIPGKTAKALFNAGAGMMNPTGTKSPMELLVPAMPKVVQDVFKAQQLSESPEDVLKTATGKMLRDPDGVDTGDIVARGAGFGTLEDKEARQRQFWQLKANQEFTQAKSRFSEGVATARYKMALGARRGDPELVNEGRAELSALQKELIGFAKDNNINLNLEFWRGFNTSVQDRLWQKLNPGKIRKPTKGEIRHIESLIEETD